MDTEATPWIPAAWKSVLYAELVVILILAAYSNSFFGPFIFDDIASIKNNTTIRHLWPPTAALFPPSEGQTVQGRPVLNLSFALNRAVGGLGVFGFHVTNVAIHIVASLLLFGIVRRTLLLPSMRPRFGRSATQLAAAISALWAVHPLLTESVTYVVQRAESLAGLFLLLTLYCFIRAVRSANPYR
ncbi:MAG TPA: hypothetical protein VH518_08705, partial [Tepidisphaeraceae bacterium]